jgi:hypothetical protein
MFLSLPSIAIQTIQLSHLKIKRTLDTKLTGISNKVNCIGDTVYIKKLGQDGNTYCMIWTTLTCLHGLVIG